MAGSLSQESAGHIIVNNVINTKGKTQMREQTYAKNMYEFTQGSQLKKMSLK